MEIIIIKTEVDKSQLTALESEVAALQNKTIKLNVESSGLSNASKSAKITAANLNEIAAAGNKAADGIKKTGTAAKETGDQIGTLVTKVAKWAVATTLIYGPVRAFQKALDTMKAVNTELTEVSKVTNLSKQELRELGEQAYKTASAYGTSADAYLSSVAEFSRAGYDNLSASLAELSAKTQIAGNVSAETANKFLLTVDAAYQYNGSVTELSKVLDGAAKIDNEYATSIGAIAEGLGNSKYERARCDCKKTCHNLLLIFYVNDFTDCGKACRFKYYGDSQHQLAHIRPNE